MTVLEQWKAMAVAENLRARRNWAGLASSDKPVPVVGRVQDSPPTDSLEARIMVLENDGLAPEQMAATLDLSEAVIWEKLRGQYSSGQGRKLTSHYRRRRAERISRVPKSVGQLDFK